MAIKINMNTLPTIRQLLNRYLFQCLIPNDGYLVHVCLNVNCATVSPQYVLILQSRYLYDFVS